MYTKRERYHVIWHPNHVECRVWGAFNTLRPCTHVTQCWLKYTLYTDYSTKCRKQFGNGFVIIVKKNYTCRNYTTQLEAIIHNCPWSLYCSIHKHYNTVECTQLIRSTNILLSLTCHICIRYVIKIYFVILLLTYS